MKVAQTLFTLFVAASSTAARERRTADSVNARLRGRFSAEGVSLESGSAGARGEGGRFEAGTPEFLGEGCQKTGGIVMIATTVAAVMIVSRLSPKGNAFISRENQKDPVP